MLRHALRVSLLVVCILAVPFVGLAQSVVCVPTTTLKTTVSLTWAPRLQDAGVTLTGYILERQTDSGPWVALTPPPALTQVTATDTGLVPGHTYSYRLSLMGRLTNDTTGIPIASGYATYGTPAPCVSVTVVNAPASFTATPQ